MISVSEQFEHEEATKLGLSTAHQKSASHEGINLVLHEDITEKYSLAGLSVGDVGDMLRGTEVSNYASHHIGQQVVDQAPNDLHTKTYLSNPNSPSTINNLNSGIRSTISSDSVASSNSNVHCPGHEAVRVVDTSNTVDSNGKMINMLVGGLEEDESDDAESPYNRGGNRRSGRRKIRIEYIDDKSRRHITFSKRKAGIMKKAYELSTLTGTQVLLLVASETGHVYTFATPKLQPLITKPEGKNLIQACLNAPEMSNTPPNIPQQNGDYNNVSSSGTVSIGYNGTEDHLQRVNSPKNGQVPHGNIYDERGTPLNYAAAMAGLAGYSYAQGAVQLSVNNSNHINPQNQHQYHQYPTYVSSNSQYNSTAMNSGFWPGMGIPSNSSNGAHNNSANLLSNNGSENHQTMLTGDGNNPNAKRHHHQM